MNFKTTLLLILVLAAAGVALFLTQRSSQTAKPGADATATDVTPSAGDNGTRVFDVAVADVAKVTLTPATGTATTLVKSGDGWRLTAPVDAPADPFEVDSLLRAVTDVRSRAELDPATDPKATGLDAPRYRVEVTTKAGKTFAMDVGDRAVVGGNLYVHVVGAAKANLVAAALADQLDRGTDLYRSKKLVTVTADQIRRLRITRAGHPPVELAKAGAAWTIVGPAAMPADDSAVTDLTYAVAGLQADSFAKPNRTPANALARPQVTVAFSTDVPPAGGTPTTVPTTLPADWTTLVLGNYDDVLRKNVYASVLGSGVVAKVPATLLETFGKSPLDLRDKAVVDVDPAQVTKISISVGGASTSQPAVPMILERRKAAPVVMGPMPSPTTGPATTQAATKPTTVPAAPPTEWMVATDKSADGDDAKVAAVLAQFHPLRTEKFHEPTPPTTAPFKRRITVELTTKVAGSPPVTVVIVDPGNDAPPLGTYNGLTFEVPASLVTDLTGDFHKGATPATPTMPGGMPAGMPPGMFGR